MSLPETTAGSNKQNLSHTVGYYMAFIALGLMARSLEYLMGSLYAPGFDNTRPPTADNKNIKFPAISTGADYQSPAEVG